MYLQDDASVGRSSVYTILGMIFFWIRLILVVGEDFYVLPKAVIIRHNFREHVEVLPYKKKELPYLRCGAVSTLPAFPFAARSDRPFDLQAHSFGHTAP